MSLIKRHYRWVYCLRSRNSTHDNQADRVPLTASPTSILRHAMPAASPNTRTVSTAMVNTKYDLPRSKVSVRYNALSGRVRIELRSILRSWGRPVAFCPSNHDRGSWNAAVRISSISMSRMRTTQRGPCASRSFVDF